MRLDFVSVEIRHIRAIRVLHLISTLPPFYYPRSILIRNGSLTGIYLFEGLCKKPHVAAILAATAFSSQSAT